MAPTKKYYAWTPILLTPDVDPDSKTHKLPIPKVQVGEEVNPSKLGVDQDEFNKLIEHGVVRTTPYPDVSREESPKQSMMRKARLELAIAEAGGLIDDPNADDDVPVASSTAAASE